MFIGSEILFSAVPTAEAAADDISMPWSVILYVRTHTLLSKWASKIIGKNIFICNC